MSTMNLHKKKPRIIIVNMCRNKLIWREKQIMKSHVGKILQCLKTLICKISLVSLCSFYDEHYLTYLKTLSPPQPP